MRPRSAAMRSRLVPLVLAHVRARGGDADGLADRHRVPAELRAVEGWSMDAPSLSVDAIEALCDRAASELGEPLLGLHVARSIPRGTYGVLEFVGRNAPTVRAAVQQLVRYQRLINDAVEYGIVEDAGTSALTHGMPGRPDGVGAHGNLFTLAVLHRFLGEIGAPAEPIRVDVAHRAPRVDLEGAFGGAEVRYGVGHNALVYPASVWAAPLPEADPALLPVLHQYAARLLPAEDPASGWRARVRDHLRRTLSGGPPSLEETAHHLSTSGRNLQRQLAEVGTTYSKVVDELREAEARRLLADPALPIGEIAFLLGYSETRAFLRAFKRWTGTGPQRFRAHG